ncbi:hypothetical protein GCM10009760_62740 [Kitasatospora kazusensis]|uniref:Secreted protein n=1 Tax=Kitasatospora kazusensis TaxID=407974 RepID=A0ABN1ZLZ4_9ACTN
MRRSRLVGALGAAALLLAAAPGAQAAEGPADEVPRLVGYFAGAPLAGTGAPIGALPPSAGQGAVRTDTPRGYLLRGGGATTDYIYTSADVWAIEADCGGSSCRPVQQVKLGLKEYLFGGDSRRWRLTLNSSPWPGPSGFAASYGYECGVNIAGDTDRTCSTWKPDGADGPASGPAPDGTELNHSFGRTTGVVKFPMVDFKVRFADGSTARGDDGAEGEKFRGWDVCVGNEARLCPTTGKGD